MSSGRWGRILLSVGRFEESLPFDSHLQLIGFQAHFSGGRESGGKITWRKGMSRQLWDLGTRTGLSGLLSEIKEHWCSANLVCHKDKY